MEPLFLALREVPIKRKTLYLLTRSCMLGRMNFLMRIHHPSVTGEAASWFDNEVNKCLLLLLENRPLSTNQRIHASLSFGYGGMGIRSAVVVAPIAYTAAQSGVSGRQKSLTEKYEAHAAKNLYHAWTYWQKAVYVSWALGTNAMSLFRDPQLYVSDNAFTTHLCLFLHIDILDCSCVCGLRATNNHVFRCRKLKHGVKAFRHDHINNCLVTFAKKLHHIGIAEPTRLVKGSRKRPDAFIHTTTSEIVVDVSVVYSGVSRYSKAHKVSLHAADQVHKKKHNAWDPIFPGVFRSFVLEHTGAWHGEAETVVQELICNVPASEREEMRRTIVNNCLRSLYEGNAYLFTSAWQQSNKVHGTKRTSIAIDELSTSSSSEPSDEDYIRIELPHGHSR